MGGLMSRGGMGGRGGNGGQLIQSGNDGEDGRSDGRGGRGGKPAVQNNQDYNNDRNSWGGTGGKGGYGGPFRKSGHDGEDGRSDGRGGKGGKPAKSAELIPYRLYDIPRLIFMTLSNIVWTIFSFFKQPGGEKDENSEMMKNGNEERLTVRKHHYDKDGKFDGQVENHEHPSVLHDRSCNRYQRKRGGKGGNGDYGGPSVKGGHDGEDGSSDGRDGRGGKPAIPASRKHEGPDYGFGVLT